MHVRAAKGRVTKFTGFSLLLSFPSFDDENGDDNGSREDERREHILMPHDIRLI